MTVNPYAFQYVSGVENKLSPTPTFAETLSASLAYQYDPIFESIGNYFKYRDAFDSTYNPLQDMEGYEEYAPDLIGANNQEHMFEMKRGIDDSKKRREVLYNSSMLSQIGAGIFDPINLFALPFGGFGVGIARSAFRVGAGTAAIQTGLEAARYPFDPVGTVEESVFNVGTAFAGGMILGGLVSIPLTKRAKVQQRMQEDIRELNRQLGIPEESVRGGEFVYHGTNIKNKKIETFIDTDGNLTLKGSADDFVGEKQFGVSLGEDFDTSVTYTAYKDKELMQRFPDTEAGDDAVIFRIKKSALEKYKAKSEAMGEIFVSGDMKIAKGDFEVIRFGKNDTGNQSVFNSKLEAKEPFAETKLEKLNARRESIPKEEFGLNKNKDKLKTAHDKVVNDIDTYQQSLQSSVSKPTKVQNKKLNDLKNKEKKIRLQIDGINRAIDENNIELKEIDKELHIRNQIEITSQTAGIDDPYGFDGNMFMNSFLFKGVTTAMKRILQSDQPDSVKLAFLKLANDSGLRLNLNKYGKSVGNSVHQNKEVLNGEWITIHDMSRKLYSDVYHKSTPTFDVDVNKKGYNDWLNEVSEKHIKGLPLDENEKQLAKMWTEHWTKWEKRLKETGQIGDTVSMQRKLINNEVRLEKKSKLIKEMEDKVPEQIAKVDELIDSLNQSNLTQGQKAQSILDDLEAKKAEGFFTNRMGELEKKLREQKSKGVYFTPKQHNLFSKLIEKKITKQYLSKGQLERGRNLRRSRDRIKRDSEELEFTLQEIKDTKILPPNEESFFPRFLLKDKIRDNRDVFVERLVNWFRDNPKIIVRNKYGELEQKPALSPFEIGKATQPEALLKRANETTDRILGLDDTSDESIQFFGHGVSKHFKHRTLDIPNKLITEFIELNPLKVMRAYNQRVAGQYEFQKSFNRSLDDVLDDMDDELYAAGKSIDEINATRKDFMHLHDRIVGRVLRDPNTLDQKTARILRDMAQLNYLGSAGFATLPDFAKIVMEHELGDVMQGLLAILKDNRVKLSGAEGRLAGELADLVKGDVHMRLVEDVTNNPLEDGIMTRVRNAYYFLNGLTPMTHTMKFIDSVVRGHSLIKLSKQIAEGKATAQDTMKLAQYNIDESMARRIAAMPVEQTDGGLYLPNTIKWADADATQAFRSSMNSGILNTVLMGTPADKPNIVDGIVYIPMRVAKRFGLSEDPKYRGYARIENGLLGLPFQFYSYTFAATNKITAAFAQGQIKNRAAAVVTSVALGYLSMDLKTPDYVTDKMEWPDLLARSIDNSGLIAMYSDFYYRALHTSAQLGGPDIGMGTINPKFPVKPSVIDPVTDVLGAGPSIATDITKGVMDVVQGNVSEGSKQVVRNLPGARMWFWKDEMNQLTNAFKSFGRY